MFLYGKWLLEANGTLCNWMLHVQHFLVRSYHRIVLVGKLFASLFQGNCNFEILVQKQENWDWFPNTKRWKFSFLKMTKHEVNFTTQRQVFREVSQTANQKRKPKFILSKYMIPYNNLVTNLFPFLSQLVWGIPHCFCVSVSKLETFTYQLDSETLILLETFQQPFCRLSFLSVLSLYISLYLFSATLLQ